jgi:TolA-binding protein
MGLVRRRLLLLVVLTASALPALRVSIALAIEEPDRLWRVGASAFEDKLYATARDVFKQLVDRFPGDPRAPEAWLLLGKARFALNDPTAALEAFQKALASHPPPGRSQEAKFWEAESLFRLKRYVEARAAYDQVVRSDAGSPLAPDAMYGLAWSELELKRFEPAVAAFRQLLEVPSWASSPQIPPATFALARALVDLRRYDEALPLLQTFGTKYPDHKQAADAQYLLGWTRLTMGQTKDGIQDLRAFVAANPSHELVPAARQRITEAVQKLGDRGELETEYRALMADAPATPDGLYLAGTIAAQLGQRREQEAAWMRLQQAFPEHALARRSALELATLAYGGEEYDTAARLAAAAAQSPDLASNARLLEGEAELKLRRYAEALAAFTAALAAPGLERGQRVRALAGSAVAHEELGQGAEALRLYDDVAAHGADPALKQWARESMLTLAKSRLAHGELELALDAFRRAQKASPPPGRPLEAKFGEAETLFRRGRYPEARAAFETVARAGDASPFAPDAVYWLGWIELEQKRLDVAIRDFRHFLEQWPEHALAGDATFVLARTLVDVKRFEEALPVLVAFMQKYPTHEHAADAQYLLGLTRLTTHRTTEGIADLRAFVAANPTHELVGVARQKVVEAVLAQGDKPELAREYESIMGDAAPTPELLYTAATIAAELGRPQDQEAAWDRLRRDFPAHALARRAALEQANAAFKAERYDEAIALAGAALPSAELAPEGQVLIGESELKLRRYRVAIEAFTGAARAPGVDRGLRFRALAGSAQAREELQEWTDALALYEEVGTDSPDPALRQWAREAVLSLGKARLARGDLGVALDAFEHARAFVPAPGRSQEARFWEAETLFRRERYAEARAAYEAVVRADASSPLAPDAVYGLAWLELGQKRLEPAIQGFRQFVEKWPDHRLAADAMWALGRTLVDVNRYDEAVPVLASFTQKYPGHEHAGDVRYLLGWTRLEVGNLADGITDLRAFVAANPTHPLATEARRRTTEAVKKLADPRELALEYQTIMAETPATPERLYDAGQIAGQLERTGDQETAWKRLRQEFPTHALATRAALDLGGIAYRLERYDEAVALATDAATSADQEPQAQLLLGESELKRKNFAAAFKAFETALKLPALDRALRYRALAGSALAQEEEQRLGEALKLYEEVAAESPDPALGEWSKDRITAVQGKQRRLAQRAVLEQASGLLGRKRYGEAVAQARAVTESDDGAIRFEGWLVIGNAELRLRRYAAALEAFTAATQVPDIDPPVRLRAVAGLGQAFEGQRQWAEALEQYEAIVSDSADPALKRWAQDRAAAVKTRQKAPKKPDPKPANRS